MSLSKSWPIFTEGLWRSNPVFRLILGMCPTLAVTTSMENGLGMGLATAFVLICSNMVVSLIREWVPKRVRIPIFVVVIATFVTVVDLVMHAYAFSLWKSLGLFIPLIVVNCIILGRAEAFASKNKFSLSLIDGIGMGIGFTWALCLLGLIREILGTGMIQFGTFAHFTLPLAPPDSAMLIVMILPPGAFLTLGFLIAAFNAGELRAKGKIKERKGCCS